MGRKCSVKDCKSDSQSPADVGVTFHKVPHHTDIRPKWFQLCNIIDEKKVVYVCSRHFLRADFCSYKGRKYMLRQGVLPSIFPWSKPKTEVKEKIIIDSAIKQEAINVVDTISKSNEMITSAELETEASNNQVEKNSSINNTENNLIDVPEPVSDLSAETNNKPEMSNIMKPLHIKTDVTDIKDEILSPKSIIEQNINSVNTPTGELTFVPNTRIEALDFKQIWCPATILEVDYEENEVLVHFDMHSTKFDEWIGINSHSIRALPIPEKIKPVQKDKEVSYELGERCMASWSDARKFPARITKVMENSTYEVLFDDGYSKTLKSHRISKCSSTSPPISPLFHPVSSTKEERRNTKRKHNIKSLFTRKRAKTISADNGSDTSLLQEVKTKNKNDALDSWLPKWENQRPVGHDSFLFHTDGYRKSVLVSDPRLPENYEKHMVQRTIGQSIGKWDVIIVTPEGKKLRGKAEAAKHIEDNPQLNLKEAMFDFSVYEKSRRRRHAPSLNSETPKQKNPDIENANQLKIKQVADGFECPIDGCGKKFRRENLAQMHVKHYHPEFTKFLDSTPNVADLAYARTVGENLDRSAGPQKENRVYKPKLPINRAVENLPSEVLKETVAGRQEQTKDMEIIKLLNSKPYDSLETPLIEPLPSGLPPSMYPDIKLKDLLSKSEPVPKESEINLMNACRSSGGLKTLLPVKRDGDQRRNLRDVLVKKKKVSDMIESSLIKTEPYQSVIKEEFAEETPTTPFESNTIIEGGEVIKIVRMKQEEIINCTCGIKEEDGLMIQCELCLCWQHAYCNNIQKENEVPEKYVCYICRHPAKERASKRYYHDQDWLKLGALPTGSYHCKDEEAASKEILKLKTSHDISGGLVELNNYMHSIKMKIKIAETKNHPKLYLWAKGWDKSGLPENQQQQSKSEFKTESPDKSKDNNESLLFNILKTGKLKEEISAFPKLDLNSLIENNLEQMNSPSGPQPLHPIETSDCKMNLLENIAHCQSLVEERINNFEKELNDLDPTILNDSTEDYAKIMNTTSMLVRDLNTLKELSQVTTF